MLMRLAVLFMKDLRGLIAIQSLLLLLTFLLTSSDRGDVWVQLAWLVFLIPGWLLAPFWTGTRAGLPAQYAHAVIGSLAAHGWLAGLGSVLGMGFPFYFAAFACLVMLAALGRVQALGRSLQPRRVRMNPQGIVVWVALMILVIVIYRDPRSNDIFQFSLQQQDMAASRSLQPSDIGVSALGVDQAMPRWRSHLWHLWPCLIADVTSSSLLDVLRRWAPIPLAFAVLASLIHIVRALASCRTPCWASVLAVLGPVILWFRSYNAFNYSFRVTNNFCLDKDLCLFLLIPATFYLSAGWLRGNRRYAWPLVALVPAILKFHPMTAVYLVLLVPMVVIGYSKPDSTSIIRQLIGVRQLIGNKKTWLISCGAALLLACVVLMGDAQSSHQQINRIVQLDFADAQQGRPLHYWAGQYAAIPDHGLSLDTTAWTGGWLHLQSRVLLNCGLLGAAHVAWLVWLACLLRRGHIVQWRRWIGFTVVLVMLWAAWLISPLFLSRYPYYLAGYERIHWFAYVPALIAVANAATLGGLALQSLLNRWRPAVLDDAVTWAGSLAMAVLMVYSAIAFGIRQPTVLGNLRGLNSLLDFELPTQIVRDHQDRPAWAKSGPVAAKPAYLRSDDRVLFLDTSGNDRYWLIKQGVFWSELYAEAFALQVRGENFLADRRHFYALLDRIEPGDVGPWIRDRGVTLIVDRRDGADRFLQSINQRKKLRLKQLAPGVWRVEPSATE